MLLALFLPRGVIIKGSMMLVTLLYVMTIHIIKGSMMLVTKTSDQARQTGHTPSTVVTY